MGLGDPWVGGEPFQSDLFKSDAYKADQKAIDSVQYPLASCQLMGYLNAASELIIASDEGNSLKLNPGPGSYPVYGCFENGKLVGLFIDFRFLSYLRVHSGLSHSFLKYDFSSAGVPS